MIKNKSELYLLLEDVQKLLPSAGFSFHFAYDGVQLEYNNSSATLTEFLSKKEMINYLRAFRKGILFTGEFGSKQD